MVTFHKMDVTYEKPTPTPVYYGPANPIQLVPNPTPTPVYYGPANPIQLVPNPTPLCQETAPTPIEEKKENKMV